MTTKEEKFQAITADMLQTYRAKNADYGDAFSETYKKLGLISAVTRITDKTNRLVSLASGNKQQVADESIEDTLKDLANYAVMTLIELQEGK